MNTDNAKEVRLLAILGLIAVLLATHIASAGDLLLSTLFGALTAAIGFGLALRWRQQELRRHRQAEQALSEKHRELQEVAQQLEQSRNMLQLVIETIPVRVFWKDRDLRYLGCNRLLAGDAGFSDPQQLLGQDDFAMVWSAQAERYQADDRLVMGSRRPRMNIIEPQTSPTGATRWLNTSKVPLQRPDGEIFGILGIYEDITNRKQAVESFHEHERQMRALVASLDDIVLEVNDQGICLNIWAASEELLLYPKAQLRGQCILELPEYEYSRQYAAVLQRVLTSGRPESVVYPIEIAGRRHWFISHVSPIPADDDAPATASILIRDITEQRQVEEALRAEQLRFAKVAATVPGAICTFLLRPDGALSIPYASRAFEDLYGLTLADVAETIDALTRRVPPDQIARLIDSVAESARTLQPWRHEYQYRHPTKGAIWVEGYSMPVREPDGSTSWYGVTTDITARKRIEQELLELNATLEARVQQRTAEVQDLYENAPIGYHSLDAQGCFSRVNQTLLDWLGYASEELIGRPVSSILAPASLTVFEVNFQIFKERGWLRDLDLDMRHKDGTVIPVLISATAIYDEHGRFVISRSTVFHNAERKKIDLALRHANAELGRAVRAKDEFLATMSHELRTPLNAILALSESLLEQLRGPLNERQQESLRHIEASGRHLLVLINDILDLSKVEAGRLDLQIEPVLLDEVCQASLAFVKEVALKKSLKLALQLSDPQAELQADPQRLKQMLVNLLSNAVKFTPADGQVSLTVSTEAEAGIVRLAVQDSGIGIAPADLTQLFQPFRQLDTSLSRQHAGTGLGLALVRRLAELHGGSVAVESTVGQGSCFTIALPYRPSPAPEAHPPAMYPAPPAGGAPIAEDQPASRAALQWALSAAAATPGAGLLAATSQLGPAPADARILLAEDNEVSILAIGDYLQARGYRLIIARNGREALDLALTARPDLILMDIQMPEIDGLEATRRLRARPECAATPIIALTALAMPGDRERCLAAGANAYLTKPVSLRGLAETIAQLLRP